MSPNVRDLLAVVEAARALYEEVEMAESHGICLPERTPSLNLAAALAALDTGFGEAEATKEVGSA